jgi:hypothetical protein
MVDANRLMEELTVSSWGMTALAVCLETGILDHLGEEPAAVPELAAAAGVQEGLVESLLEVVAALGIICRSEDRFSADPELAHLVRGPGPLALLSSGLLQQADLIRSARAGALMTGWRYHDPHILQAQGVLSAGVVRIFEQYAFGHMEGLSEMLGEPGATFLDVGAGVAAISIAMCRAYPLLRAIGLEPAEAPRRLAVENIAKYGLAGRIEIRAQRIEELEDVGTFHLAQIPIQFLPTDVVLRGLQTTLRSLLPGGWVILQVLAAPGPELTPAVLRLWTRLWGGEAVLADQAVRMVEAAGFAGAAILPAFPGLPTRYVVGRRP